MVTTVPEVMVFTPVPVKTGKSMPVWLPLDQLEPEARYPVVWLPGTGWV